MSANSNDPSNYYPTNLTDSSSGPPSTVAVANNDLSASDSSSTPLAESSPINYLFLFILLGLILLILLFLFLFHRRTLRRRQNQASGVHALALDVERFAPHDSTTDSPAPPAIPWSRAWIFGRFGRYDGAGGGLGYGGGEEHVHGVVRQDEGLDEHGEAPPPYEPGSIAMGKPRVEVGRENVEVQTEGRRVDVDETEWGDENGNRNGNVNANANANERQNRMAEDGERSRIEQLPGYNEDREEVEDVVITPLVRAVVSADGRMVSDVHDVGEDDATRGRRRSG